jgi:hypothetical protein
VGEPTAAARLWPAVARYGLARLLLVAAVAALLCWLSVPLLLAVMIGVIAALPLSMLLLSRQRAEMDAALATAGARRRAQKAQLRAALRGETVTEAPADGAGSARAGEREADGQPDSAAQRPDEHDQAGGTEHRDQVAPTDATEHPSNR